MTTLDWLKWLDKNVGNAYRKIKLDYDVWKHGNWIDCHDNKEKEMEMKKMLQQNTLVMVTPINTRRK
jgi:hypothetical protein